MSKPVFTDVFAFSGRRNRKSYILLALSQLAGFFLAAIVMTGGAAVMDSAGLVGGIMMAAGICGFFAIVVSAWASGSQRIRDFGYSGVWILVTLIPYVGWIASFAIMLIPSDPHDNRYGSSSI
jgi:uncharacterized membrane protein YhaH (DUF805 family)